MKERIGLAAVAAALALPTAAMATPNADRCQNTIDRQTATDNGGAASIGRSLPPGQAKKATAAQAPGQTITLGPYREVPDVRSLRQVDADHNHANSVGDSFSGRSDLFKGRRKVGTARFKSTIATLSGSTITTHDVVTIRLPGGHLYVDTISKPIDQNEQEHVGAVTTYSVARGDGRFAGYTGTLKSVTIRKPTPTKPPIYRDTATLTKGGGQP